MNITRESEGDEVKAFIQHIVNHLDIKIRLFRYGCSHCQFE
jgi:hypothetical protein